MSDEPITKTRHDNGDSTAIIFIKILEVLNRNGGRVAGRIVTDTTPLSGVDCLQFVAGGSGAVISTITAPDIVAGDASGFELAAGQPFPFEFTAISLSSGTGYAVDRLSP